MRFYKFLTENGWISGVTTKWSPEPGFFTRSAQEIARGIKAASNDEKQAMSRLNFYINRAGSNLSKKDKARLEEAKKLLQKLYESINEGIWRLPADTDKAEIDKLFSKPLTAKDAGKKLFGIVGMDSYHDMLYKIEKAFPEIDVRALTAYYVGTRFAHKSSYWQELAKKYEAEAKKSKGYDIVVKDLDMARQFPNS